MGRLCICPNAFGMCNSPRTFSILGINTFQKYLHRMMEVFLDDYAVYNTRKKHAQHLQECFDECMAVGISINTTKSVFLVPFGKLVGHIISTQGVATNSNKNRNYRFVTYANHSYGSQRILYRCFIFRYSIIAMPLTMLLKKIDTPPSWTHACTEDFIKLKKN